jgi:hypothetical protein
VFYNSSPTPCGTCVGSTIKVTNWPGTLTTNIYDDCGNGSFILFSNPSISRPFYASVSRLCSGNDRSPYSDTYLVARSSLSYGILIQWTKCSGVGPTTINVVHIGSIEYDSEPDSDSDKWYRSGAIYGNPIRPEFGGRVDEYKSVVYWVFDDSPC